MSSRKPAGIIRGNPVTPAGPDYNGTASGIWTVQEAAYWTRQGLWPTPGVLSTDPYFENVSLLLHGDGLGNANNNLFMDSSSAATIINRNGNTTQGQFSPYSPYWSCYFDGSGDYLTYQNSLTNGFGTGDFTIEGWVYCSELPGANSYDIIDFRTAGNQLAPAIIIRPNANSNTVSLLVNGVFVINGPAFPFGQWNHIAVCRSGTSTRLFVNGVQGGSTYSDSNNYGGSSPPSIGAYAPSPSGTELKGYISNIRAVKGYALYTSNFTPPTTPLTSNAGGGQTGVFTCAFNRIFDGGTSVLTITTSGNVSVSRFSPFQPGVSFQSGSSYGQSFASPWAMAVDGTGDYLTTNASPALGVGAGDFTLECWVYYTTSPDNSYTLGLSNAANDYGVNLEVRSGYPAVHLYTGTHSDFVFDTFGEHFRNNQWNHWALSRVSGVLYAYVNGVRLTKSTTFTTDMGTSGKATIGNPESNKQRGFISNVRYTIGVAAYSGSSYVVPSGPLQATRNTGLLTCQSSTFVDNSSNNLTINTFGDVVMRGDNMFQPGYSSVYFDGDADYFETQNSSAFNYGTGDFTIECWGYRGSPSNFWCGYSARDGASFTLFSYAGASSTIQVYSSGFYDSGINPGYNTWFHVAVVRQSGTMKIYINGVLGFSGAYTTNIASHVVRVGSSTANEWGLGYVSNLRVVKGTAVYTGAFTPPTAPLTAIANTQLLTCQNTALTDNSTNNFIFTSFGNTTVTGNSPFLTTGYYSGYFDGSGDYLSVPTNSAFDLSNGNFTLECWVYNNSISGDTGYMGIWDTGYILYRESSTYKFYYYGPGFSNITASVAAVTGAWTHLAVVRNGTTMTFYINGTSAGTASIGTTAIGFPAVPFILGANWNNGSPASFLNGYMSNARLVKGTAVYTSNFTPPTGPLTAISGTSLLTLQNGRFIDNSTNNFTITRNGDTRVQTFNPFSSRFLGDDVGSIYFDGSGDWLNTSGTITLPSAADFTLEFWLYPFAAFSSNRGLVACSGTRFGLITEAGSIYFLSNSTEFDTNVNPIPGTWNHIAMTRSGGTIRIFLNGTQIGTRSSNTDNFTSQELRIGSNLSGEIIPQSYMANVRFIVGTAVYTGNFTPPAVATPSIPGTVLNLNGSNAGVFDQTTINSIETVGDADLSTAVKKYGTGSIYFDGTGDYLTIPTGPQLYFGTSSFTIEAWIYPTSGTGNRHIFSGSDSGGMAFYLNTSGKIAVAKAGVVEIIASTTTIPQNTFTYVAASRSGNTFRIFVNGTLEATVTSTQDFTGFNANKIGFENGATAYQGYIDELRITNGIARYTADFFPPPGPFPNY